MRKIYNVISITATIIVLLASAGCSSKVSLCFAGDILLDRGVRTELDKQGYDYPYQKAKDIISRADIAYANLECPLTHRGTPVLKDRKIIFRGDVENGSALKRAGFDVLNLANNHAMDYGYEGIADTITGLTDLGIYTPGGGTDRQEARKPVFIEKRGCVIGFLGYSVFPPEGYISFASRPDTARIDYETLETEISAAGEQCNFLVVSFHWGNEFDFYPEDSQKKLAHTAIDSGADLVIGHHPHVLQGVERYKDRLIFYSLGNFVFDRQIQEGTDESIMLDIRIEDDQWKKARIIPVRVIDCQPRPVKGSDAEYILSRLKLYSEGMNTDISVTGGIGHIEN